MAATRFALPVPARLGGLQRARAGRLKVGLLGGSFNPAHDGHRHVALTALRRLGLDEVWWMVAPQNPLKPTRGMAPYVERLAVAQAVADHPRLVVTDVERALGTVYTAHSVAELRRRFPGVRFVWLMGADNLAGIDQWLDWPLLFASVPVAVIARPGWGMRALTGLAAQRFRRARIASGKARGLARRGAPAWTFLHGRMSPLSATRLREAAAEPAGETPPPFAPDPDLAAKLLKIAVREIDEMKGEQIIEIDLAGKAEFADWMVIASGRSARQVGAIAEKLRDKLKEAGARKLAVEGLPAADWVLIDAGDLIVHVFRPEVRRFYNLEKMWGAEPPPLPAEAGRYDPGDDAG